MVRSVTAWGLVLVLAAGAFAETRTPEENVLISPIIVTGKIGKAAGEFKENGTTYKKVAVVTGTAIRAIKGQPKTGATITIWTTRWSETYSPRAMDARAWMPSDVPVWTCSRRMSPVEICGMSNRSTRR